MRNDQENHACVRSGFMVGWLSTPGPLVADELQILVSAIVDTEFGHEL